MNKSENIKAESSETIAMFLANEYETFMMCQKNILMLRQEILDRLAKENEKKEN